MSFRRAGVSLFAVLLVLAAAPIGAAEFAFRAKAGILIDAETGMTLAAKDADRPIPPASMSKLMTLFMAFEALRAGRLAMDDEILVTHNAFRRGGSTMFLKQGQRVAVSDILRGVVVQSGNDAAIALAEALAGTEAAFADQMTVRAREIGMTHSRFVNATGWPDPDEFMSVRDIAIVTLRLIEDFPDLYPLFAERAFEFNGVKQNNRNPLLDSFAGADGLKTGHTQEAGYGLAASARRGDRRLISVVAGLPSKHARGEESERLLNWGFRTFENRLLFRAGDMIVRAPVWMGDRPTVGLVAPRDVLITAPKTQIDALAIEAIYAAPTPAPIAAGAQPGDARVVIALGGDVIAETPLVALETVKRPGPVGRVMAVAEYYLFGGGL